MQLQTSLKLINSIRKDFGYKFGDEYVLPADWQGAFSGGPVAS
jgi:hypothetical protein